MRRTDCYTRIACGKPAKAASTKPSQQAQARCGGTLKESPGITRNQFEAMLGRLIAPASKVSQTLEP
jgi:hypothetical protein